MDGSKVWNVFKTIGEYCKNPKNFLVVGGVLVGLAGLLLFGWKTTLLIAVVGAGFWLYTQWEKEQKKNQDQPKKKEPLEVEKIQDAMWEELK